jgi:acyl-CoA reductase-like NAD-dependent aldehyde dehydrogenase
LSVPPPSALHVPLLRGGEPYRSLSTVRLSHVATGEPVADVSQANPGLIAHDLQKAAELRRPLDDLSVAELVAISKRAGQLFAEAELPLGDATQGPDEFVRQISATTGLPETLARGNMSKARFVLEEMETVLGGLTRGLDLTALDRGYVEQDGRLVSYRRETDVLGAVLPSNSPGVHSLWLPAIPLKVGLALKPGRQEPWTPYRIAQAFIAAGCPRGAFNFYPTDYAGAGQVLLRCGRSLLYGDRSTVGPWEGDPRVQVHGPGWSKVVFGSDQADAWQEHLEILASSVADNGGRSCINASGVWSPANAEAIALGLAERLARIEALPLDHPEAQLAAFPSREAADRLSEWIDARLAIPGAVDMTARVRPGGRVAEAGGCAFLLPTVIYCRDPQHPLAQAEFLFPFVAVVDAPADRLVPAMGSSLVVTALTQESGLTRELLSAVGIERLNLAPVPTSRVAWDQPHEGNLFEHLYRQRALQTPAAGREPQPAAVTG